MSISLFCRDKSGLRQVEVDMPVSCVNNQKGLVGMLKRSGNIHSTSPILALIINKERNN